MSVLSGNSNKSPPVWFMRQAGRYLPEYRELRTKSETFLDFCYNPKLATEATLQPINRYDFDAAILFSDILVVPDALGQRVSFETGEGPRLEAISSHDQVRALRQDLSLDRLNPVFETIAAVRAKLSKDKALIGFCGAPWTVASYMIAGRGTPDQAPARLFAYRQRDTFRALIDMLTLFSIEYLVEQFKSGVDAVQIFDSWAGVLPAKEFETWCYQPLQTILSAVRARIPDAAIIAFPRGAGTHLAAIAKLTGLAGIGLDTAVDPVWAVEALPRSVALQGNLDPLVLLSGGAALDSSVDEVLDNFAGRPHIFNLGHGILPATPTENVARVIARIRRR